MRRFVEERRRE